MLTFFGTFHHLITKKKAINEQTTVSKTLKNSLRIVP